MLHRLGQRSVKKKGNMSSMRSLNSLFTRSERLTFGVLVLLMILSGLLEVFGIGLLFPYVTILQNPDKITENTYLSALYRGLGFKSDRSFLIAMSGGLLTVFLAKGVFSLWTTNFQLRFINAKRSQLGQTLLARYLSRPYAFFLSANTSTLIGNLTTTLGNLCGGVMQSTLSLIAEAIVLVGLLIFLICISPGFSLLAIVFFGLFSITFFRLVKSYLARYSVENDQSWKAIIRVVNEGLSAVKEVQVMGRQQFFIDAYGRESRIYAWTLRRYTILVQLPRIALEAGAVAGMVLFAVFAILGGGFEKESFSVLAVFAVATIRIVPSTQRILQAINAISFFRPAIDIIAEGVAGNVERADDRQKGGPELRFRRTLSISIKSFSYSANQNFCLKDINFVIQRGQTVAFIGRSGSGKTTLIDLILGLFPEFGGEIKVDGCDIRENISAWQRRIGYIPQSLYLRDDTIMRNVAFGVPDRDINKQQVQRAVNLAGLDQVIQSQPAGLETVVGDRGIRLSGGERQRIGIARALYHDPDLLVLDEATSALDNETERQIVESIVGLSPAKTVIIIAHRLSTVRNCDDVFLMRDGRIIDQGPFVQISERHPEFVKLQ
jgi:ABC-type bacteriocin/lantibiotic exporter with double-glycine peptidase domain